uniref:CBM20 domain-containing protein n=1 Tax=Chenopodium quinoa TaxID=63459 RepID=A0A803M823_CHEQI
MGAGTSTNSDSCSHGGNDDQANGGQLYVSLKMENYILNGDLLPHIFGSAPLVGSWDSSKALPLERESTSIWELSFVVPPNHETLDFKFLLRPKDSNNPCIIEEGPNRILSGGRLEGDARGALFRLNADAVLEYRVCINADRVSPFDLASSWRAYQKNIHPSAARGIPDVSINAKTGIESGSSATLELDLEHYVVPSPETSAVYPANKAETPRYIAASKHSSGTASQFSKSGDTGSRPSEPTVNEEIEVGIQDPAKVWTTAVVEEKPAMTTSPLQKQESPKGLFVDRGVGSPRLVKSASAGTFADDMKPGSENKVGLPARGKTFTAAKLTRYLRWLGHDTKHFNVGKYRRLKLGINQVKNGSWIQIGLNQLSAEFFRGDNTEGIEARNEVAALAMEDMISWMQEGGQVGIFDATNSTRGRRNMLMKLAEGNCKIIFLETLCYDEQIIERNIRLKVQQSPDYAEQPDFEAGYRDFKRRLDNYEKVYEPVEEGSYIKMIDTVSGRGGQIQVNTHLTPRPILLTRHGESRDNVRARIGGDSALSDTGALYAKKLADFVEKRLKSERAASVQWRALDEINAGACDGMTYLEIKKNMPEEYESREKDKLRYRYPRGESYLDVIQRLEPVIIELERQRAPVVVISHQAVLRALYAYFADRPLKEIPHIEVPLHTIIEIQMGVTGVQEKRYKLMD